MFRNYLENVADQNLRLLKQLKLGDIVIIPTTSHTHYAVYVGDYNVVHLIAARQNGKFLKTYSVEVIEESFMSVARYDVACIDYQGYSHHTPLSRHSIVTRARSKLGVLPYEEMFESCQRFVNWCRYGEVKKIKVYGIKSNNSELIECNNFNVQRRLEEGDIVKRFDNSSHHWGIYVGDSSVVHPVKQRSKSATYSAGEILAEEQTFAAFVGGCLSECDNSYDDLHQPLNGNTITTKARSKLGCVVEKDGNDFAHLCRYGTKIQNSASCPFIIILFIILCLAFYLIKNLAASF